MAMKLKTYSEIETELKQESILTLSAMHEKSFLDESFMSPSRWLEKQIQDYLISVFQNMCLTPFILVDVKLCLARATNQKDKDYYQKVLDKGYEYITCDSNNRQIALWKGVKEGTITLPVGTFTILKKQITIKPNTKWKDLPADARAVILPRSIPVQYVEKATRKDLALIFYRVNLGMTQNPQEMRQSWESDFAQPNRDLCKTLYPTLLASQVITQKDVNRRVVDEIVLDTAIFAFTKFDTRINKPTRDSHYAEESSLMNVFPVVKRAWKNITIPACSPPKKLKNGKEKKVKPIVSVRSILNNIMLRIWLEQNDYKIVDGADFDTWVWTTDLDFLEPKPEDQIKFTHPSAGITYPYVSAGRRDAFYMKWNFDLFLGKLTETKGLIELVENDEQRLFTPSQKYTLWKRQNGICPETNEKIPLEEILDSNKWQGDHYPIRWIDKGPTTVENGQLICASVNAAKANQKSLVIPKAKFTVAA